MRGTPQHQAVIDVIRNVSYMFVRREQTRLVILRKRWLGIIALLRQRKPQRIWLFGSKSGDRCLVLRASGTRPTVIQQPPCGHQVIQRRTSRFRGVLFVHPSKRYWLTHKELRVIRQLRGRRGEFVSGVLIHSADHLTLYPVHFNRKQASDMVMEHDGGFRYQQSFSALALLLPACNIRRGPGWW